MTLRELAELFVSLGARSAINLDGGGSTTMVTDGTIVNRVSDPQERRVPTALLVLREPAPPVPTPPG
jgi:exopolysaccharide biosynthesis protein